MHDAAQTPGAAIQQGQEALLRSGKDVELECLAPRCSSHCACSSGEVAAILWGSDHAPRQHDPIILLVSARRLALELVGEVALE